MYRKNMGCMCGLGVLAISDFDNAIALAKTSPYSNNPSYLKQAENYKAKYFDAKTPQEEKDSIELEMKSLLGRLGSKVGTPPPAPPPVAAAKTDNKNLYIAGGVVAVGLIYYVAKKKKYI
jgi:hypothetical protein